MVSQAEMAGTVEVLYSAYGYGFVGGAGVVEVTCELVRNGGNIGSALRGSKIRRPLGAGRVRTDMWILI